MKPRLREHTKKCVENNTSPRPTPYLLVTHTRSNTLESVSLKINQIHAFLQLMRFVINRHAAALCGLACFIFGPMLVLYLIEPQYSFVFDWTQLSHMPGLFLLAFGAACLPVCYGMIRMLQHKRHVGSSLNAHTELSSAHILGKFDFFVSWHRWLCTLKYVTFEWFVLLLSSVLNVLFVTYQQHTFWYAVVFVIQGYISFIVKPTVLVCILFVTWFNEACLMFLNEDLSWFLFYSFLGRIGLSACICSLYAGIAYVQRFYRHLDAESVVNSKLQAILTEAKNYRVLSHAQKLELSDYQAEQKRVLSSLTAVKEAVFNLLKVLDKALPAHVMALYLLEHESHLLWLKEIRGQSEGVRAGPIDVREGVFGHVFNRREPLVLTALKNHRGLIYYETQSPELAHVSELVLMPIFQDAHMIGVLVIDRLEPLAFSAQDIELLACMAEELARTLEVERLFALMDREKRSRDQFFHASQAFSTARAADEVAEASFFAAAALCQSAFVALTTYQEETKTHLVRAVFGIKKLKALEGQHISDPSALVFTALKTRSILPLPGVSICEYSLFGKKLLTPALPAARVYPLFMQDLPIGTWVLGLKEAELSKEVEAMLLSLSQQVATSCANAQLNEAMEKMATTDSLTGLYNRRYFYQLATQRLAHALRFSRKVSVLICDIDHFKSVNDTHGHPIGDVVLRAVARMLLAEARDSDLVGRLGGEEFSVLLEDTDAPAAKQMAERMRERVMREVILTESGKLQVTLSLGIATFPMDGKTIEELVLHADEALYLAKNGGRNRSISYC